MELAAGGGLFRARWTEEIHDEWTENLLENRPELDPDAIARTRQLMNEAVPDSLVTNYQGLIQGLTLPDPGDRHVLAAAIVAAADGIVTFNLKDFPKAYLAGFNIELLHPDEFINHQFGLNNANVLIAAQRCRERLKHPPKTAEEWLDKLEEQGLPQTVTELRKYSAVI